MRIRNPHGTNEWTGSWSDDSEEWKTVDKHGDDQITWSKADDGEFWMEFSEFVKNFESLRICHTKLDLMHENLKVRFQYYC